MKSNITCSICLMDSSDPEIFFDSNGECNHCKKYKIELPKRVFKGKEAEKKLNAIVEKISQSKNKQGYDCVIGLSGGVDSSYVAYLVKKLGLNPLAVHLDNGWNSELAVKNIQRIIDFLDIDLVTYVINWNEFKSLQMSFFKAGLPDVEVITDHAINAILFKYASKNNLKYIVSGMNFSTESMNVPFWSYGHSDFKYIREVDKKFSVTKIKSYPYFKLYHLFFWTFVKRIKSVSILNFIEYDKEKAKDILVNEIGWTPYDGKHYESTFTKFFQGYILPEKFGIDKRKGHLSDLIRSNQLTRKQAIEILKNPPLKPEEITKDTKYVCKKLGLSEEEFFKIMKSPNSSFLNYPNNKFIIDKLKIVVNYLRLFNLYTK